jgi:hypothetical protein
MIRFFTELNTLLCARLEQIGDDTKNCSDEVAVARLEGRMDEVGLMLEWLRPQLEDRLNTQLAKLRARNLLH